MSSKPTVTPEKVQSVTTPAATNVPKVPTVPPAPAAVQTTSTAITPVAPANIAHADPGIQALLNSLPAAHHRGITKLSRPTADEVDAAINALPVAERTAVTELVERLRGGDEFRPTVVKLYQGIGSDAARPAKQLPGSFYSMGSVDLGSELNIAVLKIWDTRVLWPPTDADSKNPICMSADGKSGNKYGACDTCPNSKKKYTEGGCMPQFTMWFVDQGFTGIYEHQFSKTAYNMGKSLKQIVQADAHPWNRWIKLFAKEQTKGDKRWFISSGIPVSDTKNPTNEKTTDAIRNVFKLLEASLELDVYYPKLVRQYAPSTEGGDVAGDVGSPLKADLTDADFGGANKNL